MTDPNLHTAAQEWAKAGVAVLPTKTDDPYFTHPDGHPIPFARRGNQHA